MQQFDTSGCFLKKSFAALKNAILLHTSVSLPVSALTIARRKVSNYFNCLGKLAELRKKLIMLLKSKLVENSWSFLCRKNKEGMSWMGENQKRQILENRYAYCPKRERWRILQWMFYSTRKTLPQRVNFTSFECRKLHFSLVYLKGKLK